MRTPLVRHGGDFKHPKGQHCFQPVYTEMFLQISRDYAALPNPKDLTAGDIRFYYEGVRAELLAHTKKKVN